MKLINRHNATEVSEPSDLVTPSNSKQSRSRKLNKSKDSKKPAKRKQATREENSEVCPKGFGEENSGIQDKELNSHEESEENLDEDEEGELDLLNAKITFFENDETVEMTVGQDDFLTDEEGEPVKKRKTDHNRKAETGKKSNENCIFDEHQRNDRVLNSIQSDEETEVFFNINTNDSNSEKGHKRNKNRDDR